MMRLSSIALQAAITSALWDDVRFDQRLIRVRRSALENGVLKSTKTAKGHRDIPISESLVAKLRPWKLQCPNGPLGLVFPNGVGKVESGSNIWNRVFHPAMKQAGLTKGPDEKPLFRFHDLRHAAAALFIEQGMGPKRIQEIMGHSSITVTFDIYGYLFRDEETDAKAVDAISDRLLGGL